MNQKFMCREYISLSPGLYSNNITSTSGFIFPLPQNIIILYRLYVNNKYTRTHHPQICMEENFFFRAYFFQNYSFIQFCPEQFPGKFFIMIRISKKNHSFLENLITTTKNELFIMMDRKSVNK